jgi:hypothetical protein
MKHFPAAAPAPVTTSSTTFGSFNQAIAALLTIAILLL